MAEGNAFKVGDVVWVDGAPEPHPIDKVRTVNGITEYFIERIEPRTAPESDPKSIGTHVSGEWIAEDRLSLAKRI